MANRFLIAGLILLALAGLGIALWANWRPDEPEAPAPVVEPVAPEPVPAPAPEPEPEPAAAIALPQMGTAFVDRFEGPELHPRWFVADGWHNGAHVENDWRMSRVAVTAEGLGITLSKAKPGNVKPFSGGEIQTREMYRYGWFEIRMRAPKAPGIVTGAFTYIGADEYGAPNEVDIEITGRDTRHMEATYHQSGKSTGKRVALPFDASDGFHTYAFDWQPDRIRWFADGVLMHETSGPGVARLIKPQKFMVQLWGSVMLSEWVGKLDPDGGPWTLDVSCIAYAPERPAQTLCD